MFRHASGLEEPAPYLIRGHPEGVERTGFRLEFIPMKIGVEMTILIEGAIYKQTLTNLLFLAEYLWFYLKEPIAWMETLVK